MARDELTADVVVAALGAIDELTIATILDTGASIEEFEEAVAWAADEGEPLGKAERPLVGTVAVVYEILTAGRELEEENES
jgi:hypothetical protein